MRHVLAHTHSHSFSHGLVQFSFFFLLRALFLYLFLDCTSVYSVALDNDRRAGIAVHTLAEITRYNFVKVIDSRLKFLFYFFIRH